MRTLRRLAAAVVVGVAAIALGSVPAQAAPGPANAPEYWFDDWQVHSLWDSGAQGQGITIAEIDTGVNASLPEFAGRVLSGKDFGIPGNGQVDREIKPFGHGTAMASLIVARPGLAGITGLAPEAKLLPIAVPLSGTTDASSDDHLADAIRWAADHGAKIVSMSLGGARTPAQDDEPCPGDEQQAIYYALSKGVILFAASGNRGQSDSAVEEPGVCLGVVSVGATNSSGKVAAFSSRHPYLTLTAPGVLIPSLSRIKGTAYYADGTSQATAIAAAATALVWSKYPTLTGRQVVARLLATLDKHGSGHSSAYGYGGLDAYRAVTASVPASAPNPVYSAADPFIARDKALSATGFIPRPAPAAGGTPRSTGAFSFGSAPGWLVPKVIGGGVVALVGLLALILLVVLARIRRTSRPAIAGSSRSPEDQSPVVLDETGLEWHEILNPELPAQPD